MIKDERIGFHSESDLFVCRKKKTRLCKRMKTKERIPTEINILEIR